MEESFQLPNEVCCSNGKESETSNTIRTTTDECKKVSTVRQSNIKHSWTESDTYITAVGTKTLAEQTTTLKRKD